MVALDQEPSRCGYTRIACTKEHHQQKAISSACTGSVAKGKVLNGLAMWFRCVGAFHSRTEKRHWGQGGAGGCTQAGAPALDPPASPDSQLLTAPHLCGNGPQGWCQFAPQRQWEHGAPMPKQYWHISPRAAQPKRSAAAQLSQRIGPKTHTSRPHCGQHAGPDAGC